MNLKLGRRSFFSSLGAIGAGLSGFFGSSKDALAASKNAGSMSSPGLPLVDGHPITPITKNLCSTGNPWEELGVTPMVNIQGTVTVIGGSVMRPEVMEAIRMGNMHFCVIDDLLVKSGKWLANLCKAPEGYTALVTEGCAAAILCCYAGMLTEDYNERMQNIPDLRGFPKTEVIIQQGHRDNFDHQVRQTGVKLVVVETRDDLVAAINERTLGIHFNHIQSNRGQVPAEEVIAIAKAHNIYTFCDASADVPPKERFWELPALGFDFVAFSGGKDICGPQATGFVIGKENMVRWAQLNMSPQENRIGRVCKVGKESLFGLLKAVELFVNQDYDETLKKYDDRAATITNALKKYNVTMERTYNGEALGNVSPHYTWTFDPDKVKITGPEIMQKLGETKPVAIGSPPGLGMGAGGMSGRPDPNWNGPNDSAAGGGGGGRGRGGRGGGGAATAAVGAGGGAAAAGGARGDEIAGAPGATAPGVPPVPAGGRGGRGGAPNTFGFSTWLLKDGEDKYIANRLVEIFSEAAAGSSATTSGKTPAPKKS
jgi:L-seryl-tRNA(Ser) seleniumtransferase